MDPNVTLKCTPFLGQQVNGCFYHTRAMNFRKLSGRHLECEVDARRVIRMDRAVNLRYQLAECLTSVRISEIELKLTVK